MEQRTVLVTGAASGIGQGAARRYAEEGWRVVACDLDAGGLAVLEAGITTVTCDVSDPAAVQEMVTGVGRIDRVVHSAGISLLGGSLDQPLDEAERIWRVDYLGTVHVVRATLPAMLARGSGELVVFSSLAGFIPSPRLSAYAAAKAGINAYAEVLVREHGGKGVKIRCVCPSQVDTPQYRKIAAEDPAAVAHQKGMPVGPVLDALERSLRRNSRTELYVFPGTTAKFAVSFKRHSPRLFTRLLTRMTCLWPRLRHGGSRRPELPVFPPHSSRCAPYVRQSRPGGAMTG